MKVLNLQCAHRHSFEGWFGSEGDFQSQLARGLVECPICTDKVIAKMPSAARLNFGGHRAPVQPPRQRMLPGASIEPDSGQVSGAVSSTEASTEVTFSVSPSLEQQAAFLKALRHVVANTEDVGDQFASQARAMHYGDAEPRGIRGQATPREAVELIEEGIEVVALPMSAALKETLQ